MKSTLQPGLTHQISLKVTEQHLVPALFSESPVFQAMPKVFATGYMTGLFEWCCTELLNAHLDPGEGSLGVMVNFKHLAATPAGLTVTVDCECVAVDGKKVTFKVRGHDGIDLIGEGLHERAVVDFNKFSARAAEKASRARAA
jgi:fluoroacetyl-CoA thioesterase